MSLGFSPKYTQDVPLGELSSEHFLVLAIEAVNQLGWNIGNTTENGFVAYTPASMSSWSEEIKVKIEHGFSTLKSECIGNQVVDWGKNKTNVEQLIDAIDEAKVSLTAEELDHKYEELKPNLSPAHEFSLTTQPVTTKEKFTTVLSLFKPTHGYFVTPIVVNINILIFILMVIGGASVLSPDTQTLLKWGANFRPATLQGEWWRLVTNFFLHIGIVHLLFNMYALVYIGLLLEPHLGKLRFAAAYMLTGIAASTASLWYHDTIVSAGASGAIFGMYGVFLAMLTTNFLEKAARKALITSIGVFVAFNLVNGLKGGIDNAAHIGGLVSGFIIGYLYYPSLKAPDRMDIKLGTIGGLTIAILFTCFLVYSKLPNNLGAYDERMKKFVSMESMALEVYNMPKNTAKDSLLMEIKDRGIYYWNQNIELISDIDKMDLPKAVHERDQKLIYYCNLRIDSYQLIYKAIKEDTPKYKDSIEMYDKKIRALIDSLKEK